MLKPVVEVEVPKLIAAIRQATSNRPMLTKLLTRVKVSDLISMESIKGRMLMLTPSFVLFR